MANEFVIKNGFHSRDISKISGSLGQGALIIESHDPYVEGIIPTGDGNARPLHIKSTIPNTGSFNSDYYTLQLSAAPTYYGKNVRGTSVLIEGGSSQQTSTASGSKGGSVFIQSGKSFASQSYTPGDVILDATSNDPTNIPIFGNVKLKGENIQIFNGSLVFQNTDTALISNTKNKITTINTGGSGPATNPLLVKPGNSTSGTGGIGAHLGIEGGDATATSGGQGGGIYINGGNGGNFASSGSLLLKGGLINLNTTNTPWTSPGPVISESISLISAGNIHLSASGTTGNGEAGSIFLSTDQNYGRQIGSLGVAISRNAPITFYAKSINPYQSSPNSIFKSIYHDGDNVQIGAIEYVASGGTQKGVEFWAEEKACFRVTTSNSEGGLASLAGLGGSTFDTQMVATTGSFKYLTGQSPLKIDVGTDNTSSLEIISNNFILDTTGNITATSGILTMDKTTVSEITTTKVKSGATGGDVLEIESSNLSLDTAGKLSSTELSATTGSYSLIKGNSTLRIDNGGDDIEIVSSNFNVSDTGEVSSGGSDGVATTSITASSDISSSGTIQGNHLRSNSLTSGNVVIAGTNGRLEGTTDFTYDTSNKLLSAPTASFDHLIVSELISSSVIITSGSNIFGDESTDTQTLNGSVILGNITSATETDALFIDSSNTVKKRTLQANAFTSTTIGTTTNTLTVDNTTIQLNSGTTFNGSGAKTISAKTATITEAGGGLATSAQIYSFVTNLGYLDSLTGAILTSGDQTASGTKTFSGTVKISNAVNAGFDTNKFLVLDTTDKVDFRTGAEVRGDIDAAAKGANSDITSLSGLTTALSVAQGGTGATTLGDFLMAANDLSELNDPSTARGNLELGSMAVQGNTSVNIDGGSITGITDLAVADGGTGASNASTARTNLGLGNVEDKSSATIRGEITSANVTTALGFTPTANTGTITSVTGTAPIVSSGGTTPAISMAAASTNTNGYLTSTNWNTFNGKTTVVANSGTGDTLQTVTIGGTGYAIPGGTVLSVGGTGTKNGLTLTGTVTTSGNLTLGGTLAISNSDWSGTDLSVANGGTGASVASTARTNLGAAASGANTDITSIINSSLTTIGSSAEETTENYINFAAGKIALTQGLNLVVHAGADFRPGTTNSMNLGTSAYMWADAYSRQFISDASTISTPAFVIDKDSPTTGFYSSGNNQIGITINGSQIGYFDSNGIQLNAGIGESNIGGHLQAHCLGIGTAPSTTSGEIRAAGDLSLIHI